MSSRDYIAIGGVLAGAWGVGSPRERGVVWKVTLGIADKFKQDNVRFDREKFYDYVFGTRDHFKARDRCEF